MQFVKVEVTCYPNPDGTVMEWGNRRDLSRTIQSSVAGCFTSDDAPLVPADVRVFFRNGSLEDSVLGCASASALFPTGLFIDVEVPHSPERNAKKQPATALLVSVLRGCIPALTPFELWVKLSNGVFAEGLPALPAGHEPAFSGAPPTGYDPCMM